MRRFLDIFLLDRWGPAMLLGLLLCLLWPPIVPYEWAWEVAAGLGFGACAAALFTARLAPIAGVTHGIAARWRLHRWAAYAMLVLVLGHVAVMVAADRFVLDYLGWMMPLHVVAGAIGLVLMIVAIATREPGILRRLPPGDLRALHASAAIAAAVFIAFHVVAGTTKLVGPWRYALLGGVLLGLVVPHSRPRRAVPPVRAPFRPQLRGAHLAPSRALRRTHMETLSMLAILASIVAILIAVPGFVRAFRG